MLVDYSDSESESEQQKKPTPPSPLRPSSPSVLPPKPKGTRKNTGEDSGPKKIIVNLPKPKNDDLEDGPPTKKARIGGGLSAMLPAPKRSGTARKSMPLPPPPAARETKNSTSETTIQAETDNEASSGGSGFSVASSTRFVPQSVARKPIQPTSAFRKPGSTTGPASAKPKVSLFGSGASLLTDVSASGNAR